MEDRVRDGRGHPLTSPPPAARDPAGFVRANTALLPVPLTPEIQLNLASEALPLWTKTEEELAASGLPPPYWAFAWAGGQALARYLLDNPAMIAGKQVLDLGAGSGLTGIAAMRAGAKSVMAVDIDAFAIAAIELNARANAVALHACCDDVLDRREKIADLVLVGDLFYEKPFANRVLMFLDAQIAAGATCLIGDPGRSYLPKERVRAIATYSVPVSRDLEDNEIKKTSVWNLIAR